MMNDAGLLSKTIYPTQRVHERSLDTYFLFCRMVSLTKPSKNTFFLAAVAPDNVYNHNLSIYIRTLLHS